MTTALWSRANLCPRGLLALLLVQQKCLCWMNTFCYQRNVKKMKWQLFEWRKIYDVRGDGDITGKVAFPCGIVMCVLMNTIYSQIFAPQLSNACLHHNMACEFWPQIQGQHINLSNRNEMRKNIQVIECLMSFVPGFSTCWRVSEPIAPSRANDCRKFNAARPSAIFVRAFCCCLDVSLGKATQMKLNLSPTQTQNLWQKRSNWAMPV